MLNDSQKSVFRYFADNKPLFEAMKEFLQERFQLRAVPQGLSDTELGAFTRAQFEAQKRLDEAFTEIASCRSYESKSEGTNPAM